MRVKCYLFLLAALGSEKIINARFLRRYFSFRRTKLERPDSYRDKENLVKYKGKITSKNLAFIVFSFLILPVSLSAQLVVDSNTFTNEQLVQDILLGQGIDVSNVTFNGSNIQSGVFDGTNSNIGVGSGVILATGDIGVAVGPNFLGNATEPNSFFSCYAGGICGPGDSDLSALVGQTTYDAAVLEFDFVPESDFIRFNYVFASEEYPEFVCSEYNDVFAFLIYGPDPDGGNYNGENIARIPNTTIPVAINTVNPGTSGSNGSPSLCQLSGSLNYSSLYNSNNNINSTSVEFDGFTDKLEAFAKVVPCETYHIKLAIADASDGTYDSAVFLEENSFAADIIDIEAVTINADNSISTDLTIAEGCNNSAEITFSINEPSTSDYSIPFSVSGTATNGVDYTLPNSIFIPAGSTEVTVNITPILDAIIEGIETIIFEVETSVCETEIFTITIGEEDLLIAPVISCGAITPGSVSFVWDPIFGATGYEVSLDGGTTWVPANPGPTSHIVGGLSNNDVVDILVRAIGGTLYCSDNPDSFQTCTLECAEAPEEPPTACYETATLNTTTCVWGITGEQPTVPTTACYESAAFNISTCEWVVTGEQPVEPPTTCYESTTFNIITCSWEITGEQPTEPMIACYESTTFNDTTCSWEVTGEQPTELTTACYESTTFNDTTCEWEVTGEQPIEPTTACYESTTFNDMTCAWEVTGEQPTEPMTACYESTTFNDTTCEWEVTGEQPIEPMTACYESTTFNDTTCSWEVTGEQPIEPMTACYESTTFNDTTCAWEVTGEQPVEPTTACYESTTFNNTTCSWEVTGEQPIEPTTACYESTTFNDTTCAWEVTGEQPVEPTTACYESTTFNNTTCEWEVTGEQPIEPTTACYESTTFNDTTCEWEVTGEQPTEPTTACYESTTFNDTTCEWEVTGEQPIEPTTACYESTTFNDITCAWEVTGEQPIEPTTACYESTTFNDTTCSWEITGEQPTEPMTACYESTTFNDTTCAWEITGEQPTEPTTACYESTTFNDTTCEWEVTGEQPTEPMTACYESTTFNDTTCAWEITGEQPTEPTTACYESTTFNDTTCEWEVTGEQPTEPMTACYESTTFNDTTCAWEITGEQPTEPTTACYESTTFNDTTCEWEVTGEQPTEPMTACYESTTFNDTTCAWEITGEQPTEPTTACYESTTFNDTTCEWEVTGEQPTEPMTACYESTTFNDTTCAWEITGEQPTEPTTACYESTTFNDTTCEWEVTGEQPTEPMTACYESTTFNDTTCAWEITGEQPTEPMTACYESTTFNDTTCSWEVTGEQPTEPMTACYESTTFNDSTCEWEVTGEQPEIDDNCDLTDDSFDEMTCMVVNTPNCPPDAIFNPSNCECEVDAIPGCTDPCALNYNPAANVDDNSCIFEEAPATACYEMATFNTTTCEWEVTGEQPTEPMTTCYEMTTFNTTTCTWDITGEQPEIDDNCDLTDDSFDEMTCMVINTPNCPPDAVFNPSTCECEVDAIPGCTDPCALNYNPAATVDDTSCIFEEAPATACYETATFNTTTCEWEVTGEQPTEPTIACYESTTFNTTSCAWEITGEQPEVDDNCALTDDSFDEMTCMVINTPNCPPDAVFNPSTCECEVDAIPGCTDPCALNYNPAATVDDTSCIFEEAPATACYETATFNTTTCEWEVTGEQPTEPTIACYESTTFNTTSCVWEVTGEQPEIDDNCALTDDSFDEMTCMVINTPNCPPDAVFNPSTCECEVDAIPGCTDPCALNYNPVADVDDNSCIFEEAPVTTCYEMATFNTTTCEWEVTGEQPTEPTIACYETTTFNTITCLWEITGEQPEIDDNCDLTDDSFDEITCVVINTPNCPPDAVFNPSTCECEVDAIPGCTDPCALNYNPAADVDDSSCIFEEEPPTACYETATFNTTTCEWEITGEQPTEPTIACYEMTTFNTTSCVWDITGEQPEIDDNCDLTDDSFDEMTCMVINTPNCPPDAVFNPSTCECEVDAIPGCTDPCALNYNPAADVDDSSCIFEEAPPIACYEMATFNTTTCEWEVSGEQPIEPTTACYETTTFNTITCVWDITGEQPEIDDNCDLTDDSFDEMTCMVINTPNCPLDAVFNPSTCECEVDAIPGCTDPCALNYNPAANVDDNSCIFEEAPSTACYEIAIFNTTTCEWEVTGEQPTEPIIACYEMTTFNTTTCTWETTGEQPVEPIIECYEMATFDDTTCEWEVTGEQLEEPLTACNEEAIFNNITCMWEIQNDGSFSLDIVDINPPSCNGEQDGSLIISTLGGIAPLMYSIDGIDFQTSNTFEGLSAGAYEIFISDANTCVINTTIQLAEPDVLTITLSDINNVLCKGETNGTATANPTGGTQAYTYAWGGSNETTQTATMLPAGTHTLTLTDSNDCIATAEVTIGEPEALALTLDPTNPECFDELTGSIVANPTGGLTPYTYAWSDGQVGDTATNLSQGNYSLIITDANGCTITDNITLTSPDEIVLNIDIQPTSCGGVCEGAATVSASGGSGDFTYQWNNGETSATIDNLCSGLYIVSVTDQMGCTQITELSIEDSAEINFDLAATPVTCFGEMDGVITIENITGGTLPYTYSLDNEMFTTSPIMIGLAAGSYTVYVQDTDACVYTNEVLVEQPSEITVDAGPDVELSFGDSIELSAQINQPNDDFIFTWSPADGLSCTECDAPFAMPIQTTNYTVTATDTITGCSASDIITVVAKKDREIFIPNIFSPDYDGANDIFMVFGGKGVVEVSSMRVYDRWGELIFENANFSTDDPEQGWDGTFRGRTTNPGVFVYAIEVEFIDGVTIRYSGDVTLTR